MHIVSIFDNRSMSIARLIAYLRFSMVHGCCWCNDLVVCSCYLCYDSGSRQCSLACLEGDLCSLPICHVYVGFLTSF